MAEPVHLTFDDGPDPRWTPRVLELLARHGVTATFFMVGQRALAHPGVARAVAAAGHGLGNHSFSHRHPWRMREADARSEVRDGMTALEDVCGRPVSLFRPPFGRVRHCMTAEAALCGQVQVLWDRSAIDWGPLGRSSWIARRLARVQPGEIVLMHDGAGKHNHPEELLPVLPGLLQRLGEYGVRALRDAPGCIPMTKNG
jgi:peptidoglycan-N-acetylglucosamine deacetylase